MVGEMAKNGEFTKPESKLSKLYDVDAALDQQKYAASLMSAFRVRTTQLENDLTAKFQRELHGILDELIHDAQLQVGGATGNSLRNTAVLAKADSRRNNSDGMPHRKVFLLRNSTLTDIMEISHIRTIRAIFMAVFALFTIASFLSESILQKSVAFDLWLLKWAFGKFSLALLAWVTIQLSTAFLLFIPFSIWSSRRTGGKLRANLFDYIMLTYYVCYFVAVAYLPTRFITMHDMPPASGLFLAAEQVRVLMKIHSFVREKAVDTFTSDTGKIEPCFSQFLYFMFAPTTIYRDTYPRTPPPIQWRAAVLHLLSFVGGVVFISHIFQHFTIPIFRSIDYSAGISLRLFTESVFSVTIPAITMKVTVFFCLLHAWHNMFAEALRYGDKQFYLDWWNSTNYPNFYRTWNIVVHDWLHQYVYRDLTLLFGRPQWRPLCQFVAFIFSAVFHEYFVVLTFKCVFPVMFLLFSSGGIVMFFLTPARNNAHLTWLTVWMPLLLGYASLMTLYSMEWYARLYCPSIFVAEGEKWKDFYVPRMLTCGWNTNATIANSSTIMPSEDAFTLSTDQCSQRDGTVKCNTFVR